MSLEGQEIRNTAVTSIQRLWRATKSMLQDEAGVTVIEYGLLAALIALIAAAGISTLMLGVNGMWTVILGKVLPAL